MRVAIWCRHRYATRLRHERDTNPNSNPNLSLTREGEISSGVQQACGVVVPAQQCHHSNPSVYIAKWGRP